MCHFQSWLFLIGAVWPILAGAEFLLSLFIQGMCRDPQGKCLSAGFDSCAMTRAMEQRPLTTIGGNTARVTSGGVRAIV